MQYAALAHTARHEQNEIDLDSSIASSTTSGTKTHEKQLVSEIADSAEDI